jgi:hypothetical protein
MFLYYVLFLLYIGPKSIKESVFQCNDLYHFQKHWYIEQTSSNLIEAFQKVVGEKTGNDEKVDEKNCLKSCDERIQKCFL